MIKPLLSSKAVLCTSIKEHHSTEYMCCVMSSSLLSVAEGALMSNLRLLLISSVQSPL